MKNKNLHLIASSLIIIPVGLVYGSSPNSILPGVPGFNLGTTNQNIFRSLMGLYFAITIFWITGILKSKFWAGATLTNIFFMGGLAFGRLLSFMLDGIPSSIFVYGFFLELFFASWGFINFKKYKQSIKSP